MSSGITRTGEKLFYYKGIRDFRAYRKEYGIMGALEEDAILFGGRVLNGIEKLLSLLDSAFGPTSFTDSRDYTKLKRSHIRHNLW